MKQPETPAAAATARAPRRRRRKVLAWLGGLLGLLVVLGLLFERTIRLRVGDWAKTQGYHVYDRTPRLRDSMLDALSRLWHTPDLPHLQLDVKPKHLAKIEQKRDEALIKGLLETEDGDKVPGKLTVDGRTIKVSLRLKGDWTDHLLGDKWSFRIETKGDDHLFGMRRFSVQAPETRGYQGEPVFLSALQRLGVVVPRYRFVTVGLNDRELGVMALEEHVATELLEHSQRRDSAIVHFDETLVFHGLDDYRTAPVIAFQPKRLGKSPALAAQRDTAIALLHGFVRGKLPASQVFRVDELAAYLAAAEVFGAHHCLRWHNLRFYFDPVHARLGPIGFDANLHERQLPTTSVTLDEPIVQQMLTDPVLRGAYERDLRKLCDAIVDGDFLAPLRALDAELVEQLCGDYLLLARFRWEEIVERARHKVATFGQEPTTHRPPMFHRPKAPPLQVRAWLDTTADGALLELANATGQQVEVTRIVWRSGDGAERTERAFVLREHGLPLTLKPQHRQGPPTVRTLRGDPPTQADHVLMVETRLANGATMTTAAIAAVAPATASPVPDATIEQTLQRHTFVRRDAGTTTLRIAPGEWRVTTPLVVPAGFTLEVPAGVRLRFAPQAALIAEGPVQLRGEPGQPVELLPDDGVGFRGVVLLDPGAAITWQHVVVRDTTGIAFPGWELTGGTCFVGADVTLRSVTLDGSIAEDALNIIGGKFALHDLRVTRTRSDAFDADFADGAVHGGEFTAIGGDAIDVSGSTIEVDGTRLDDVRDKALSVGEGSTMRARNVQIGRVGTGAASKDASSLELRDSTIAAAEHFGMAAYVKKAEFGVATIRAERVRIDGAAERAVAQTGSSIVIDGVAVPPRDLDVDALYDSIMVKDPGR
ncbi:MAG: hypothetical protein R3F29_01290 [Planctomycetota bacterium]